MSIILFIILLLALLYVYSKFSLNIQMQSLALVVFTGVTMVLSLVPWLVDLFLIVVSAAFAVVAFVKPLRMEMLSNKILKYIGKALPPISKTEQAAIDAGSVWWEAELFRGNPDWKKLHQIPYARLNEEEQAFIDGPVEKFCAMLDDWQITQDKDLPKEAWDFIKKNKLFGLIIPKQYGGLGFSPVANSEIVMKISTRSGSAGVTVMVPNSLGPGELLLEHGTQKQKDYYLPRLANGEEIPCFALTGPWAGSDAGAMMDAGIVCYQDIDGEQVLGFRTSWQKRYITLAPVATLVGLAFKAYDPDNLLGDEKDLGITCALVPADTPGVKIGNRHIPLGAAFMNGPIEAKDVFIPMEWIIGGQNGVGIGWEMLMDSLAAGRAISLPASGVSAAKVAAWSSGAYASVREQFNLPIGKFEAIEEVLARLASKTYMMDATRLFTLSGLMQGEKPSVVSAIAKYHLTEGGREAINDAMDIHGGKGICTGPSNYLASAYIMTPIGITVEGANIITRSLIIFGQGAMRCHPFLLKEIGLSSSEHNDETKEKFDKVLSSHMSYFIANKSRTFLYGLTRGRLASAPKAELSKYYRQLSRLSSAFAFLADISLLMLGGAFKRKEKISSRFADALSYMYMASSVLKRHRDLNYAKQDKPLVEWSLQFALYKTEWALHEIVRNFPIKYMRPVLKLILFPTGAYNKYPSDNLGAKAAEAILNEGVARDRVSQGMYLNKNSDDVLGCLALAMDLANKTQDLRRDLRRQGLEQPAFKEFNEWTDGLLKNNKIDEDQASLLKDYYKASYKVIQVDDFSAQDMK